MRPLISFLAGIAFTLGLQVLFSEAASRVTSPVEVFSGHYEAGGLKFRREYRNGKPDGKFTEFYPNGTIKLISHYRDGAQFGEEQRFRNDGTRISLGNYFNGLLHGKYETFALDDSLRSLQIYSKGKLHGTAKHYRPDGTLEKRALFKEGKLLSTHRYDEQGKLDFYVNHEKTSSGLQKVYFGSNDELLGSREMFELEDGWTRIKTICPSNLVETQLCNSNSLRYRGFRNDEGELVAIEIYGKPPEADAKAGLLLRLDLQDDGYRGVLYGVATVDKRGRRGRSRNLRVKADQTLQVFDAQGNPLGDIVSNGFQERGPMRWSAEGREPASSCSTKITEPRIQFHCDLSLEQWRKAFERSYERAQDLLE